MNRIFHHFFALLILSLSFNLAHGASSTQTETISLEFVKSKIDALNARQGIEEATKNAVLKQYQAAQDNLTSNAQANAQITTFKSAIHQAPTQTKVLQKEIDKILAKVSKQKVEDFHQIPVEELEQRLLIEKSNENQFEEQLKKIEIDLATQNNRPALIREETVATQQSIESIQKKLALPAAPTDSKLEHEAQQLYFKTLIDLYTTELKLLDAEAASQPARVELLKVQIQLLDIQKNALAPVVNTIESLVFDLRQQEAQKMEEALSQTEKNLENKHRLIQQRTHENIQYSRDLQIVTAKIEQVSEQKTQIENQRSDIENAFKSADKKISLAGLNPVLGKILREQRRNLTLQNAISIQTKKLQDEIALSSLDQFKIEDKQKLLLNVDDALKQMIMQVDATLSFEQRMRIQAELRVLLNNQKELLNKLELAYTTYLRSLGDLDFERQQMVTQSEKFAAYLDERLLWVPSSEPINVEFLTGIFHSFQWLFSPSNWLNFVLETLSMLWQNVLFSSVATSLVLLLLRLNHFAKSRLNPSETELRRWHNGHFYYTLCALFYQLLFILPVPASIFLLGKFLTHYSAIDFNFSIGAGLEKMAQLLFILKFCYAFFCINGIARRHFQWQKNTVILLYNQIMWLRFVALPATFLIYMTSASKFSEYSDSLGRCALILMLVAIALVLTNLSHPHRGLWQSIFKNDTTNYFFYGRYLTYTLGFIIPFIIIGFAVTGYYLSALELQEKLSSTLRLVIIFTFIHEILFRGLSLVNRQLIIQSAMQNAIHEKNLPLNEAEQQLDIPKINAQTRKLVRVIIAFGVIFGCWLIWKNILPAFSFFERVVLWQHKIIIENQEIYQPITLTNLLFAGLYLFLAIVAMRNIYGVLEILVFRRWEIETGSRYAINQLAKYFFITLAFICIANELGGSWAQVQWLVAALGVGLGFGLQEIFANLVSGIILLFERPIRVGDLVTIGDVTGTVCRIQMRATTLIDSDQRELIVPNKTFITSQLTNWTLSDATTRIIIPLSIAFGSEVEFAHELILKTVKETPLILQTPEPCVLFVGFGESALNFSIRAFVNEPINRAFVVHDLNIRLERVLRENKIEIPYSQLDVHIRSHS